MMSLVPLLSFSYLELNMYVYVCVCVFFFLSLINPDRPSTMSWMKFRVSLTQTLILWTLCSKKVIPATHVQT